MLHLLSASMPTLLDTEQIVQSLAQVTKLPDITESAFKKYIFHTYFGFFFFFFLGGGGVLDI